MFRMLSGRSLLLTASLAAALATAACSSDSTGSAAAPNSTTPSSSSPAGTSAPAETSSPAAPADLVLGPTGIGTLKLGMSAADVEASGEVGKVNYLNDTDECGSAASHNPVGAYSLWVSRTKGLVGIVALVPDAHTPEGIAKGATMAAVKKAYPAALPVDGNAGLLRAAVPANGNAFYQFNLISGTTSQVILALKTQTCFG